jgi:hypothetical protein
VVSRGPVYEAAHAEGQAHVEVRSVPRLADRTEAAKEAEYRLVRHLGVGARGVGAPVLGCVSGQRGADAAPQQEQTGSAACRELRRYPLSW